jgi:hypothetical protein
MGESYGRKIRPLRSFGPPPPQSGRKAAAPLPPLQGRAIAYGIGNLENRGAYTAVILGLVPRICSGWCIYGCSSEADGDFRGDNRQPRQILGTSPRMTALTPATPIKPYAIATCSGA